ncbi:hypothetical protein CAEBREN_23927 [Caenorhabditis brenneri]|uniref:Uncharacterized protein n=1 Tax=Caenorhabditis brenneri TaxID=135651 RepID=G0NYS6_CAEBE|nr:hypothetical protein CAEBREN_23927 [Caenorhabditis brenneri]
MNASTTPTPLVDMVLHQKAVAHVRKTSICHDYSRIMFGRGLGKESPNGQTSKKNGMSSPKRRNRNGRISCMKHLRSGMNKFA